MSCFEELNADCKQGMEYCEKCGELISSEEIEDCYYYNDIPFDRVCDTCSESYREYTDYKR
jgi:hypothetical protein